MYWEICVNINLKEIRCVSMLSTFYTEIFSIGIVGTKVSGKKCIENDRKRRKNHCHLYCSLDSVIVAKKHAKNTYIKAVTRAKRRDRRINKEVAFNKHVTRTQFCGQCKDSGQDSGRWSGDRRQSTVEIDNFCIIMIYFA